MQTLIEDVLTLSKLSNNQLPKLRWIKDVIENIIDDLEIDKEKGAQIKSG
jgi:hypothetical protein